MRPTPASPRACGGMPPAAVHDIPQGEGVEPGDPVAPARQHDALEAAAADLQAGERLAAFLDDLYVMTTPERAGGIRYRRRCSRNARWSLGQPRQYAPVQRRGRARAGRHHRLRQRGVVRGQAASGPQLSSYGGFWVCLSAIPTGLPLRPRSGFGMRRPCCKHCRAFQTYSVFGSCCFTCATPRAQHLVRNVTLQAFYAREHGDAVRETLVQLLGRRGVDPNRLGRSAKPRSFLPTSLGGYRVVRRPTCLVWCLMGRVG